MNNKRIYWIKIKRNWGKLYFLFSIVMVVFFYGIFVGENKYFPVNQIDSGLMAAKDWIKDSNFNHYLGFRPEKFIHPARHEGRGATVYAADKIQEGVTLITSMWDHKNGINLIDRDGSVIHEWRVSFNEIWPETPHLTRPISDWDVAIHGVKLYLNGDIVFNFGTYGLVRIDKYSNVIWKLYRQTHHSIYEDKDKNLWVPGRKDHNQPVPLFPLLKPPFTEELLLKISPDGKVLREISILDVFYHSGQEAILSANGKNVSWISSNPTHINDIEILEESMADQFPLFDAGDIMVSMRNLNLIVIIDPVTEKIKWSMMGPYIRQHDPDFLPNGLISVYDNRRDMAEGAKLGGSRILFIDPVKRKVESALKNNPQNYFYTKILGKHQHLENGNILITEPLAGRAFEVAPSGEVVWSYINRYDDDEIYRVTEAIRLNGNYEKFAEKPDKGLK